LNSETAEKKQAPEFSNDELSNGLNIELSKFDAYRVTKEKQIPNPPPMATIGDSPILAAGNITPMTAEAKGGKTAAANVFIAGAISDSGNYDGFNDLFIQSNPSGKAVLHFDTEQSEADQQYNLKTSLTRAGYNSTPDYYRSYNTRTLPINEYQNFTSTICELASECFNGIHLIVIDGGADYITSVNDEAEANAIITYFIFLAVKYNCPVLLVIHLNENAGRNGDTMPRGHVGRQAVRKGYCQLHITKTGDVSTMQVLRARKAGNDTPVICYQYSKDHGYHISVDAELAKVKNVKTSNVRTGLEKVCKEVLPFGVPISYTDLVSKIMQVTDKSEVSCKRYVKDLQGWDTIKKGNDGNYRLNNE
jgi:hypothetical protein